LGGGGAFGGRAVGVGLGRSSGNGLATWPGWMNPRSKSVGSAGARPGGRVEVNWSSHGTVVLFWNESWSVGWMILRLGESWKFSITTAGSGAFGSASGVGRLSTWLTMWPSVVRRNIVARTCCRWRSRVAQTNIGQRPGGGTTAEGFAASGVAVGHERFRLDHWKLTCLELVRIDGTAIGVPASGVPRSLRPSHSKRFWNGSTCSRRRGSARSLTTHWNVGVAVGGGVPPGAAWALASSEEDAPARRTASAATTSANNQALPPVPCRSSICARPLSALVAG
jgi:hypothetical protein